MLKRSKLALLLALAGFALAACNTVQGVGKDIQKGGQTIEKVSK